MSRRGQGLARDGDAGRGIGELGLRGIEHLDERGRRRKAIGGHRRQRSRMPASRARGSWGRSTRTLGGSRLRRFSIIAWGVAPVNGSSPASIS